MQKDHSKSSAQGTYCGENFFSIERLQEIEDELENEANKIEMEKYLSGRGNSDIGCNAQDEPQSKFHAYVKPPLNEGIINKSKKISKATVSSNQETKVSTQTMESHSMSKGNQEMSRKKKVGKAVSLAEAAKGSILFQKGKPCSCQARRHSLVSNCLSCGKIVCEQEGEGPCNFCGALVLREGSTYAGLDMDQAVLSDVEAAAEAYAKRLVEYDRNSAARTTVIDDQSDYYNIEGNSWLSMEEKELLRKKKEEIEEAERASKSKVVMTFDLVGRKVLMNEDEVSDEQEHLSLFRSDERDINRIKPNPTVRLQPIFIDPGRRKTSKDSVSNKRLFAGLSLEVSGRVQHDQNEFKELVDV